VAGYYQIKDFSKHLKNPGKYIGKTPITLRSSWEIILAKQLDEKTSILKWASESVYISYFNPVKKTMSRYFPDFYVEYVESKSGKILKEIWEIKPLWETQAPVPGKRKSKKYIEALAKWAVNQAKWKAIMEFCEKTNGTLAFRIITEESLKSLKGI